MTTAQSIFVVYGVVILAYGLVLGVPLTSPSQPVPTSHVWPPADSGQIVDTNLGDPDCRGLKRR